MNRRMNNLVQDGFVADSTRNSVTYSNFQGVQQTRESLFFQLPAKFRGDQVTSYGGYLRFTLEYSARPQGRPYRDVDVEIIVRYNTLCHIGFTLKSHLLSFLLFKLKKVILNYCMNIFLKVLN